MEDQGAAQGSQVIQPARPLPKKYMEPILYLADRMAEADKEVAVKERSIIEDLAQAAKKERLSHRALVPRNDRGKRLPAP